MKSSSSIVNSFSVHKHPHTQARVVALQFLYRSMCENLFYFSEPHFNLFLQDFDISGKIGRIARPLVVGSFQHRTSIDSYIEEASQNWQISRIAKTDLCALRIACFELMDREISAKIVIDEAIELARLYGSERSSAFVNGVLDAIRLKLAVSSSEAKTVGLPKVSPCIPVL